MRPTFRQLQYFVAVADQSAFGAAAQELAVSQPSLSKQLATMEAELASPCFSALPGVCSSHHRVKSFCQSARDLAGPGGVPELGQTRRWQAEPAPQHRRAAIGRSLLHAMATRRLHAAFPDLSLPFRGATRDLLNHLREGRLDAVIGSPTENPEFHTRPLFTENLWICAAADDPLSSSEAPLRLRILPRSRFCR